MMRISKAILLAVASATEIQTINHEPIMVFQDDSVGALLGNWVTNVFSALF